MQNKDQTVNMYHLQHIRPLNRVPRNRVTDASVGKTGRRISLLSEACTQTSAVALVQE